MKEKLVLQFDSTIAQYSLKFEDDGKVAYAYLLMGETIIGDVWLYNRCPTPDSPEWKNKRNIPFANCREYMLEEGRMKKKVLPQDVIVDWEKEAEELVAYVYIFEDLYGVIAENDKPGYARFALKDGPLARKMHIE